MSDRCHMEIVCRREDAPLFELLGFAIECGFTLRHGRLRFSFHFYNTEAEVSRVVALLRERADHKTPARAIL